MGDYASDAGGRHYVSPKPKKKQRVPGGNVASDAGGRTYVAPKKQSPAPKQPGPALKEAAKPLAPPVPVLQTYGFHGSIYDFVNNLHKSTQAYQDAYGYKPSPGLVFDLARWNPPQGVDYPHLFGGQKPEAQPVQTAFHRAGVNDPEVNMALRHPKPLAEKYPTVATQMGLLPIDHGGDVEKFFQLMQDLGGKGTLPVREQGQSIKEYGQMLQAAGISANDSQRIQLGHSITNLTAAQTELNDEMGTHLPVTGVFNRDWLQAVANWMQSEDYFKTVVRKQASDAGYDNTQSYVRAWKAKQKAVGASGWSQHLLNALPIHMYDHGFNPVGMLRSEVEYTLEPVLMKPGPTSSLHLLTRSSGLALAGVGGSLEQGKANAAALTALGNARYHGKTYEESKKEMQRVLAEHPSWVRVFFPTIHGKGDEGWAKGLNLLGDIILLRKPTFTGEVIASDASIAAVRQSGRLNAASHFAYEALRKGDLADARVQLSGGMGAEQLAARSAPLIKAGEMSREQFRDKLAELYRYGETDVAGNHIQGAVLPELRGKALPTPSKTWLRSKDGMKKTLDGLDAGLRKVPGGNGAAKIVSGLRAEFNHYVQPGSHYIYDETMPERIRSFVLKETKDPNLADRYANRFVRARAKDDLTTVSRLEKELTDKYNMRFPRRAGGKPAEEFQPELGTEAKSTFKFPGGGRRDLNVEGFRKGLNITLESTRAVNRLLVKTAVVAARFILAVPFTGYSLFYKHMIADTARRTVAEQGFIAGRTSAMKRARQEITDLANSTPEYSRLLGATEKRAVLSENRWLLNRGQSSERETFQTGKMNRAQVPAAGAFLRRHLDDDALQAYLKASDGQGLDELTKVVQRSKTYRSAWKKSGLSAQEYAENVFENFRQVEDGLHASGFTFDDALQVLKRNRGVKVDEKLGAFLKKNGIDVKVTSGQVEHIHPLDQASSWWIGKLMTFNKWNRGQLYNRTLEKTYADLTANGVEKGPALQVSVDLAERVVKHHMLDFSNRLQIEQDLRWVSYFATKHRLYWKWVLGTLIKRPGAALVIRDAQNAMGNDGQLNFGAFGHDWAVPLARLMWVPGKEYSETSPLLNAMIGIGKTGSLAGASEQARGTFGNIVTRNDTAVHYGLKLLKIKSGKAPATYGYATAGLDDRSKAFLNFQINSFQNSYYEEHGHFAPESEAVKWALLHQLANEAWRSNLPLPVLPDYGQNEGQKLLRKFLAINDPAKRRSFLDKHNELSLYFGIYRDPEIYTHVRGLWAAYTKALDRRDAARMSLFDQARESGFTPEMQLQRRAIDKEFNRVFKGLLKQDLDGTPKDKQKELNGQTYGWWGQMVADDPLADPRKTLKQLFPNLKNVSGVPGDEVKKLRQELTLLNDPKYVADTFEDPSEAKSRKAEILQQIEVFNAYPKDALGRLERDYQQKYVGKYWDEYQKRIKAIVAMPKNEKDLAYADLREWKDAQDKPVTINGVKFPSPLRMAWATLDPVTKRQRLAQLASGNWEHLADYEKDLLGKQVPKNTSAKWNFYEKTLADYRQQYNFQGKNLPKGYKAVLAKWIEKQPGGQGFYKEYLFAEKPPYERLKLLRPVQESKHHDDWVTLLNLARDYDKSAENSSPTATRATWKKYVQSSLEPELQRPENRAFYKEIQLYGPDFLYTLAG